MKGRRRAYVTTVPQPDFPARKTPPAETVRRPSPSPAASRAFVPAGPPDPPPAVVEILPPALPAPPLDPGAQAQVRVVVTGSHTDRARGFALVVNRLGLTLGGLGVIVAVVGLRAPLFSLVTLGWFGSLYAAAWLAAYGLHVLVSAEGAAWWHVWQGWRWLGREQRHRHQLERHAHGVEKGEGRR